MVVGKAELFFSEVHQIISFVCLILFLCPRERFFLCLDGSSLVDQYYERINMPVKIIVLTTQR